MCIVFFVMVAHWLIFNKDQPVFCESAKPPLDQERVSMCLNQHYSKQSSENQLMDHKILLSASLIYIYRRNKQGLLGLNPVELQISLILGETSLHSGSLSYISERFRYLYRMVGINLLNCQFLKNSTIGDKIEGFRLRVGGVVNRSTACFLWLYSNSV